MKRKLKFLVPVAFFLFLFGLFAIVEVSADTIDELKLKIAEKGDEIDKLEKEINEYTREIIEVQAKSKTLANSIYELDLTKKKLMADIEVTNSKIETTNYILQKIQTETNNTIYKINDNNKTVKHLIQNIDEMETKSLVEVVLANNELSDFWNDIENMQEFRSVILDNLRELEGLKIDLQNKKAENEKEKKSLIDLESKLQDQKKVVEINKKDKSYLLTETNNKESNYQKILADKKAAKEKFEKELSDFESQLKMVIDQSRLPSLGSGVLGWPLQDVSLIS